MEREDWRRRRAKKIRVGGENGPRVDEGKGREEAQADSEARNWDVGKERNAKTLGVVGKQVRGAAHMREREGRRRDGGGVSGACGCSQGAVEGDGAAQ